MSLTAVQRTVIVAGDVSIHIDPDVCTVQHHMVSLISGQLKVIPVHRFILLFGKLLNAFSKCTFLPACIRAGLRRQFRIACIDSQDLFRQFFNRNLFFDKLDALYIFLLMEDYSEFFTD